MLWRSLTSWWHVDFATVEYAFFLGVLLPSESFFLSKRSWPEPGLRDLHWWTVITKSVTLTATKQHVRWSWSPLKPAHRSLTCGPRGGGVDGVLWSHQQQHYSGGVRACVTNSLVPDSLRYFSDQFLVHVKLKAIPECDTTIGKSAAVLISQTGCQAILYSRNRCILEYLYCILIFFFPFLGSQH
jgi:hypothetical protein